MDNIKMLHTGATAPVKEIAEFVAHSELDISADGDLYVYISDVLAPDVDDCKAALEWACAAVNDEEHEHTLALVLNFPQALDGIIDGHRLSAFKDRVVFDAKQKSMVEALRAQFQATLNTLDQISFEE